ncbi:MAG: hypothetical protein NW220_22110 [Leptolyngbyaceae cyanobacterium bins.349]|nr:hypothetical protein [Leptolyngbyaceae cyanobacterium bins.349]
MTRPWELMSSTVVQCIALVVQQSRFEPPDYKLPTRQIRSLGQSPAAIAQPDRVR